MPTLRTSPIDRATVTRVRAYATAHALSVREAAAQLLTIALDHLDARRDAGRAAHRGTTPAQRSAAATHAVTARWAQHRGRHP